MMRALFGVLAAVLVAGCGCGGKHDKTLPVGTGSTPSADAGVPVSPTPDAGPTAPPVTTGERGKPCNAGKCAGGLECVKYYGIAGPGGPQFTSCETQCDPDGPPCPDGLTCRNVADGPGAVCR